MVGKLRLLFWTGIVLICMPLLGIPRSWKTVLTVLIGCGIVYIVFRLRYAYKKMKFESRNTTAPVDEPTTLHG